MPNHSRIGTPFINKDIWSTDDALSVRSDVGELDKLDTAVQQSSADERNTAPSQIEEGSLKSILPEISKEPNSSERMNLANSLGIQTPKLVSFGHPPMQTDNEGNPIDSIAATIVMDQDRIWRPTERGVRTTLTYGDVETMSEKLAHCKYIKE